VSIELDIVRLYDQNLRGVYTIRGIAQKLGHAYPYVHRTIQKLLAVGAFRAATVGGSKCISIDLRNRRAVLYLTELELEKRAQLPDLTRKLADALDHDGTMRIETAVATNGTVYIVGDGQYPGAETISRERFIELLLTTTLFSHHTVLYGYERFFSIIAANQPALDDAYHPLTMRAGVRL
jgi:hypothetical protein